VVAAHADRDDARFRDGRHERLHPLERFLDVAGRGGRVERAPKTCTRCTGLYVRIIPEADRIASGPKRAPERNDVPPSQGSP
jgi:hypothetical protein